MSDRRRLLLTLLNQGVWLPYSFEYLYHSLVPQTISGKNVRNKAKLGKIYGESEVRNQIVATSDVRPLTTTTTNGITFTNNNDGSITISGTASADFYQQITRDIPISVQGHSWLIFSELLGDNNKYWLTDGWTGAVINDGNAKIQVVNTSYVVLRFNIKSGVQINQTIHPQLVDLTKAYPFDTPTTLTDNRVQAILNRGYIPYNTGTIENTDIGEFSSEPYNLFDEELEQGNIQQANGQNALGNQYRSTNYTNVLPNRSFTFEYNRSAIPNGSTYFYLYEYDKNHNYIDQTLSGNTNDSITFTTTPQTYFVRFKLYNSTDFSGITPTQELLKCCIHATGTRTGYAPHTAPQTISFKYQGSGVGTSKDSMTIDKDNVVFTKANVQYTFSGTENWNLYGTSFFYTTLGTFPPTKDGSYPLSSNGIITRGNIATYCNIRAYINSNPQLSTSSDMNTIYPNGSTILYPLATPQTITIPRKKLGVKRVRDLTNLAYLSSYGVFVGTISDKKASDNNIYCYQFLTTTEAIGSMSNLTIRQYYYGTASDVLLKDTSCSTTQQLLDKHGNDLIFYETENEVADIIDTIGVEAGGTLTSDSEVLPNVDTKIKGK